MDIKILPLGELETNCYVLISGNEAVVIDPAENAERIIAAAGEWKIKYIVLTHAHFDHMGAAAELKEKTGAELICSVNEEAALSDGYLNLSEVFMSFLKPVAADILVREGDEISFGESKLKVIETPGHTFGSISLYGEGVLFSGDTLFRRSVGRVDFPTGNAQALINSVKEKLFKFSDNTVCYTGHGPSTTIGEEKAENPYVR